MMEPQFLNFIKKVNSIFLSIGMSLTKEDTNRPFNRFKYHWKFFFNLIALQYGIFGQIVWIVLAMVKGTSLLEITILLPCMTICLLGEFRLGYFMYHIDSINDVINCLKTLDIANRPNREHSKEEHYVWFNFLKNIINLLRSTSYLGVAGFIGGALIVTASHYNASGELKFMLPFIGWYPFDAFHLHFWPLVCVQQTLAAWMAINSIIGPDCFLFTCCTFIHLQFKILQQDLEKIVKENSQDDEISYSEEEFVGIVNRHRELIRCVKLLDGMYSKSTLFSVATSSLIICASGFNLKVLDDYVLVFPFVAVLIFGLSQVNLHCYYGDYVMRSSMQVGDAIYNSRWYEAGVALRKCLLIVLVRSIKPCKFTASGFTEVNLMTFARILSSSWSYFAVLNQMYRN